MPKLTTLAAKTEITTEEQAQVLCNAIRGIGLVAFDTETTNLAAFLAKPVVVSYSLPKVEWNNEWGDQRVFGPLFNLIEGSRFVHDANNYKVAPLVVPMLGAKGVDVAAHNWKYDAHIINRHWGFMPGCGGRVFDTMVMDFLLNENRPHGLKECCEDYDLLHGLQPFNKLFRPPPPKVLKVRPDLSASEWAMETNRDRFLEYAATDPYATLLLLDFEISGLKEARWDDDTIDDKNAKVKSFWDYYLKYEEPFFRAVWEMERNGVKVIPEHLAEYGPKIDKRKQEIVNFYASMCGRVVNLNSTDQLTEMLYNDFGMPVLAWTKGGKTGNKQPSTDKNALTELAEAGFEELVGPLQEYRKIDKLKGTYVDGLGSHIRNDGLIHGTFSTHIVVTGRLSSSEPNLQNIENRKDDDDRIVEYDIRKAFVAEVGRTLIVADFKTLEVVITAHISQDAGLIKALNEGLDLHAFTAAGMFGVPYAEIIAAKKAEHPTHEQKILLQHRKNAKTLLFGILYGMGEQSLAIKLGVTEAEAKDYIDRFFTAYPKILQAKEYWSSFCANYGFILTMLNRRRRLSDIWSKREGIRNKALRQLFNACIQGTAADLMRFYMVALVSDERLKKYDAILRLQVHDEVVVDCPVEHAQEVKKIVEEILTASMSHIKWAVPLQVDAKIANSWSEGK